MNITVLFLMPILASAVMVAAPGPARAAACAFDVLGEGRVAAVIDARSFRLDDGREILLVGIEPAAPTTKAALAALLAGREVTLRGEDDAPDRYGRQRSVVFVSGSDTSIQGLLVSEGHALVSAEIVEKDCTASLLAAEDEARRARKGTWAGPAVIKNAESPDDILAGIGRFSVVEGRVISVRQAGAVTYLNFGHNWTRDFAVTISRRMMPAFEAAGLALKSLEKKRVRVRGWIEGRTSPRMEVIRVGQIELLGAESPAKRE